MYKDKFRFVRKMYRTPWAAHFLQYFIILVRRQNKIRSMIWIVIMVIKTSDWNWLYMAIYFVQIRKVL